MLSALRHFLKLEAASGILLFLAAVLAMIVANSPLAPWYGQFLDLPVAVRIGPLEIAKPLLLWINDGLMAVFFLLVGLELKREVLEGELADPRQVALPAIAAIGGMIVPALVYCAFNSGDPVALRGWAIPAATDIAFALGILALLGSRVPLALKVFLVSIAIFDDLGAIVIIALFYTQDLSMLALGISLACLPLLLLLNRCNVTTFTPYMLIGLLMWTALLKSGIHATLAGVVLALFVPMRDRKAPESSPLRRLEHDLHTGVAFGILPLFAFANAGISFAGVGLQALTHPVALGVAGGLLIGKPLGVYGASLLGLKLGIGRLPESVDRRALFGVAVLCGIGFTMSLFIGSLAFPEDAHAELFAERFGIVAGSLVSGLIGFVLLRRALPAAAVQAG
ncbi:Na+/H+ antiporter NhaA [Plasticicumulans sp.]|uniref:Na+/H+ antiporter NhaA n=1 Tax=Plasticicumulans sp. TaxID=2307179 RepID=UPI000FAF5FBA|nr:Na+/H+ antiporter NhaA [Plasticicumulans sp.]MBS0600345.1 Na+/H+ antiporter NhaA [Pseudomonadota bacterium]RTK99895.1 MAG: Na+/H+ antiporter NhaA [Xanthomonadales bacterium]HMV39244.1 Na+/H+ antiporter NhaA [Plasticicumulans sp.]HMW30072.1 Na+/H+ antiporter NhaA [Plasticicumulans sp.]HMW43117.1 Na+/H+ antiporter NhaA [Plasticicumulans sp.]